MIQTLKIIYDIEKFYVTNTDDVDYRLERIQSLRYNIFYLVSFKQFVKSKKQDDDS